MVSKLIALKASLKTAQPNISLLCEAFLKSEKTSVLNWATTA